MHTKSTDIGNKNAKGAHHKKVWHKGWAIVWNVDIQNIKKGTIVSLHTQEPVSSQEDLFEVREIIYKIK